MLKTAILFAAQYLGLFSLCRYLTRRHLRILCYHGTWLGPAPHYGDCLFMNAKRFQQRMDALKRRGYRVIPLAQACERLPAGRLGARDIVITIDDGWKGAYRHMLPVLEECGFPATLYIATEPVLLGEPLLHLLTPYLLARSCRNPADHAGLFPELGLKTTDQARIAEALAGHVSRHATAADRRAALARIGDRLGVDTTDLETRGAFSLMDPDEIRLARARGVDVQLHTHTHRMHNFDAARVATEITLNRQHLAPITGQDESEFVHFCYPSGLHRDTIYPILRRAGIRSATTTDFGLNAPSAEPLALKRILDCESMSNLELEARLCGFWSLVTGIRAGLKASLRRTKAIYEGARHPVSSQSGNGRH
ncbi:polysaccharide deacetylase family protein [Thauera sinica]|uniref:Polysaccharide deacetylase family protein n=1 Tax=Thauera sinica TaxID=2665146 RepID=A0ABW1AM57_9RHOO|nr:polysaccharide deacetylase family protein [Thauera sp. K11]